MKNIHVTKHKNGWQTKKEGNQKATSIHKTQKKASNAAKKRKY